MNATDRPDPSSKAWESPEQLITNIMSFSKLHGNLLNKYNLSFYLNHFDRNRLLSLSQTIGAHRAMTPQDFMRLMLLNIPH